MKPLPLSVLFVEPDGAASHGLRRDLRRRGAHVRAADRPGRALMLAEEVMPDLVVIDDAFEAEGLSEALRARAPDAEMILLGAHAGRPGLGFLVSSPRPASERMLVDLIDRAFPGRLSEPAVPRGASIVCVDDDPRYLKSIARFLAERGWTPHAYEQGEQALAALDEVRPALALVDVMMPGMDGLDLAAEIRSRTRRRIPVVLLTGLTRGEVSAEGRGSGASLYLEKACDPSELAGAVEFFAGPGREAP